MIMIWYFFTVIAVGVIVGFAAIEIIRHINQSERKIMSKLSELAGQLAAINTKVDAIAAAVSDPALPADAQTQLDTLTSKIDALAGGTPAPTTTVG